MKAGPQVKQNFNLTSEKDLELAAESLEHYCYDKLPFYSIRIDEYEHRIKRYATRALTGKTKCTVTYKQLVFSFRNDPAWRDAFTVPSFCANIDCGFPLDFKMENKEDQTIQCETCDEFTHTYVRLKNLLLNQTLRPREEKPSKSHETDFMATPVDKKE